MRSFLDRISDLDMDKITEITVYEQYLEDMKYYTNKHKLDLTIRLFNDDYYCHYVNGLIVEEYFDEDMIEYLEYDDSYRLTKRTINTCGDITYDSWTYDDNGRLLLEESSNGNFLKRTYDNNGNLIEVETHQIHVKYEYNEQNAIIKETKKGFYVITFDYCVDGFLTEKIKTDDDGEVERWVYDFRENVVLHESVYGVEVITYDLDHVFIVGHTITDNDGKVFDLLDFKVV